MGSSCQGKASFKNPRRTKRPTVRSSNWGRYSKGRAVSAVNLSRLGKPGRPNTRLWNQHQKYSPNCTKSASCFWGNRQQEATARGRGAAGQMLRPAQRAESRAFRERPGRRRPRAPSRLLQGGLAPARKAQAAGRQLEETSMTQRRKFFPRMKTAQTEQKSELRRGR